MAEVRGVVLHIAQGTYEGTIAWQRNPSAQVSSHFVCGKNSGERAQMVDTDQTAWTQAAGNGRWLSIEFAGYSGERLTEHQVDFAAQILARAHQAYGVPLQLADSPSDRGLGWHGMGGQAWGNHPACPGKPIIAQRPEIIARAKRITAGKEPLDMATVDEILNADKIPNDINPGTPGKPGHNPFMTVRWALRYATHATLAHRETVAANRRLDEMAKKLDALAAAVKRLEDRPGQAQELDYEKFVDVLLRRAARAPQG